MLSAVDTMLESAPGNLADRPQQLFMTGDQIYGDDVAASLLFALIDAGNILFEGNKEEVLPLVQIPARMLAPGERREVVQNKAMLTTSTPENHLLAFAEYAAMYLFAWSDVLWPEDLPGAEDVWNVYPEARPRPEKQKKAEITFADHMERLRAFRSTLLQVRRALANLVNELEPQFNSLVELIRGSSSTRDRLETTGVLKPEVARDLATYVKSQSRKPQLDCCRRKTTKYASIPDRHR